MARLRALEAAGVQELVAWPFPAPGQDLADMTVRLSKDVLPHVSDRRNGR